MIYREFLPPPTVASFVRCAWTLSASADEPEDEGPTEPVFPDGCPEVILNFGDPFRARRRGGSLEAQPPAMLVGQITRPFHVAPTGSIDLLALRLEPHGGALFVDDMRPLTEGWCALEGEPRALLDTERHTSSDARVARAFSLVDGLLARRDPSLDATGAAVRAIIASRGTLSTTDVAARAGVSLRALQRRFVRQVGITPKLLARIVRFQAVFRAWRDDPRSIATVAAACGYFDQSHLSRDFREFAGEATATALEGQAEFTALFLPR